MIAFLLALLYLFLVGCIGTPILIGLYSLVLWIGRLIRPSRFRS